jgi:hypothetical protein
MQVVHNALAIANRRVQHDQVIGGLRGDLGHRAEAANDPGARAGLAGA